MAFPREKIALVVFLAVLALMGAGVAWYLVAGHSWNYAATTIDDAAGEMDGYRVILYEGTAIPTAQQVDSSGELSFAPTSLAAERRGYEAKGAAVFSIDALDLDAYRDPVILEKGAYRVGVFFAAPDDTAAELRRKAAKLADGGANVVVAVTAQASRLAAVEGVDVTIDLAGRGALSAQPGEAGLTVKMPAAGRVGAIIVSPAEVVSARTIPQGE